MAEVNSLGFNCCTTRECNCGWNLQIGSKSVEVLEQVMKVLLKHKLRDVDGSLAKVNDYIEFRKEV